MNDEMHSDIDRDANRKDLPYRKNCEGYFVHEKRILARDTNDGFIEFPGGGIEDDETAAEALSRETLEETGAMVTDLKEIVMLRFDWGPQWAKTSKQKSRYTKFRGEEMHFFIGKIAGFTSIKMKDLWEGEKLMNIQDVIEKINDTKPFDKEIEEYREMQLKILRKL